ncbi:glycosyltransferase [Synechocystis sp. PCC 7509]|uniref:glycosyltransferase n=1 Tax=Synechocystis sp. PCC 7509 TaxID=927677 RepID=UPI0002AD130A|nr:glycosyltransferase [Synechocystis sp. PCC 7509]
MQKPILYLWVPNIFEFKGGIQVYLQDVIKAIKDNYKSLKITVFDKLDKSLPDQEIYSTNINFIFSGNAPEKLRTYNFTWQLISQAWVKKPQLIICGHLNFAFIAFLLYQITKTPYWIIVYGVDAWMVTNYWQKKALHQAEKIISISGYTRDRLIKEQNLKPEEIVILPVTFDASRFQIAPKPQRLLNRYGLKAEQPIILTVARLDNNERYKGYDQILQALPQIRRSIPNIHYILVGKGADRPRIEQLIKQLALQECVTLTGFIPDEELGDHYNLCDVFAMPSKKEGFGIVYLEALACGKPVVGGNQDGAMDALAHGELGVMVDPDNIEAIAQTLIQILQNNYPHPILYQPQVLRQKVMEKFGFERFQQTVDELLQTHFISCKDKPQPKFLA